MDEPQCSGARAEAFEGSLGLRIGAIFILLVSSGFATLFPVVTKRVTRLGVPNGVFEFAKYFGSGIIIATAFIHLLAPGVEELSSPCLNNDFQNYPFAFAFAMIAMFLTFIVELVAFRVGQAKAQSLAYDPHLGGHHHAAEHANHSHRAVAPASGTSEIESEELKGDVGAKTMTNKEVSDVESLEKGVPLSAAASEILGVAILEFGVIFHSIIIGITLGTTNEFVTLFIVIIFHQMFEGLGLGSRLALLPLKPKSPIPYIGAIAYAFVTPLGVAIGLGVRSTYNAEAAKASYITGTFDSISAGILLYTGLVELLAHEFIFNEKMRNAPLGKVMLCVGQMLLGAGLMALLGRWA